MGDYLKSKEQEFQKQEDEEECLVFITIQSTGRRGQGIDQLDAQRNFRDETFWEERIKSKLALK